MCLKGRRQTINKILLLLAQEVRQQPEYHIGCYELGDTRVKCLERSASCYGCFVQPSFVLALLYFIRNPIAVKVNFDANLARNLLNEEANLLAFIGKEEYLKIVAQQFKQVENFVVRKCSNCGKPLPTFLTKNLLYNPYILNYPGTCSVCGFRNTINKAAMGWPPRNLAEFDLEPFKNVVLENEKTLKSLRSEELSYMPWSFPFKDKLDLFTHKKGLESYYKFTKSTGTTNINFWAE